MSVLAHISTLGGAVSFDDLPESDSVKLGVKEDETFEGDFVSIDVTFCDVFKELGAIEDDSVVFTSGRMNPSVAAAVDNIDEIDCCDG